MLTLYYAPKTRALRARWMLEELHLPYELIYIDLQHGEQHSTEYLCIHPHGQVPALKDNKQIIFESGAICAYLADKHIDKGLAPKLNSPERAQYLQWLFYVPGTLEPTLKPYYHLLKPSVKQDQQKIESSNKAFNDCAQVLSETLKDRDYLLGEHFSTADILVGAVLFMAKRLNLLTDYPILQAYVSRLRERPACQNALLD